MNLIKRELVSFSVNLANFSDVKFVIRLFSESILIEISLSLFFSLNFNSNKLKVVLEWTVLIYSEGKTLMNIKTHRLSSKVNNFLLSLREFLFCIIIELSDSPLKKK